MKKILLFGVVTTLLAVTSGGCTACQEQVPAGYVGVRKTGSGGYDTGTLLKPGHHTCWGRDKLVLLETAEVIAHEKDMKIQCADDMNITMDLKIRSRLKRDKAAVAIALKSLGSKIHWLRKGDVGVLKYEHLARVFVTPQAREIVRIVTSKFRTTQVRANREKIKAEVMQRLTDATKNSPVAVLEVIISNIDPPAVVRKAIEQARKREIEIQEEKAKQEKKTLAEKNSQALRLMKEKNEQAMKLLIAQNKLDVAKVNKAVKAQEAETEAIRMRILARAATPAYFQLRALENQTLLYSQPRGATIVTNGSKIQPIVGQVR